MSKIEVLRRVDDTFNRIVLLSAGDNEPMTKRRKIEQPPPDIAGGFLLDDAQPDTGGGFVLANSDHGSLPFLDQDNDLSDTIPLSLIPDALQQLDLAPDDEEVLQVFRNAASGWTEGRRSNMNDEVVTRKDFRAVCCILLGVDGDEPDEAMNGEEKDIQIQNEEDEISDENEEDPYEELSSLSELTDEDDGDDDYQNGDSSQRKSTGRSRKGRALSTPSDGLDIDDTGTRGITPRQKKAALTAFALFFPSIKPDSPELLKQRITLRDIIRITDLLREKMKTEEMLEMLGLFSSSPDKSVDLSDFERIMVAAKLA